jgi:TonB family protein
MQTLNHSDYQLTIIDSGFLIGRLANQVGWLGLDLEQSWSTFRKDPWGVSGKTLHSVSFEVGQQLRSPTRVLSYVSACFLIALVIAVVSLVDSSPKSSNADLIGESLIDPQDIQLIKVNDALDAGIGKNGDGEVGFKRGKAQGSGAELKARGGGSGGNKTPIETQQGKLPQSSEIQAAIPTRPQLAPALPVAGIDIDPALWNDSKAPQYGDPNSKSQIPSHGPGDGGGIGTNQGLGIGDGKGPGYGPGEDGNMGGDRSQRGCCDEGGARNNSNGPANIFKSGEVEQRARLLAKPEPQYTEEARRNQVTGTVTLRCVFSSAGDVVQIHTIQTLPFGLTERAIVAARQIKFIPAMKGGHPVSVWMQLEYNFNLY